MLSEVSGVAPYPQYPVVPPVPPAPRRQQRFWQRRWVRLVFITLLLLIMPVIFGCGLLAGVVLQRAQDAQDSQPGPLLAPQFAVATTQNVAYGPMATQGEQLDLCQPQGITGKRPGIIFIHGGGWVGGDKTDFTNLCRYFASLGFIGANIDYRLAPAYRWPAQIVDAQLAVRWLHAHAADLHLDDTHLCAFGASAGGQLSLLLGMASTIHSGDQATLLANEPVQVNCVVSWSGPTDLAALSQTNPTVKTALHGLFGATFTQADLRDASPLFQVTATTAPTLLVQGKTDDLVPRSQAERLQQVLQSAGVFVTLVETNGGHSLGDGTVVEAVIQQSATFLFIHDP